MLGAELGGPVMDAYVISRKAYLMLVVEALAFANEQATGSAATREKIAVALRSAKRDLASHVKPRKRERIRGRASRR